MILLKLTQAVHRLVQVAGCAWLAACVSAPSTASDADRQAADRRGVGPGRPLTELARLELVETAPVETVLDNPNLRETWVVWQEMIERAESSIDLMHFYASDRPATDGGQASRLELVVRALERAAERGVRVRFVADAGFFETYPDTLTRLDAAQQLEVRLIDLRALTGGVQHAKALIVDGREVFIGSQNFDWRALEHIQELGVRIESRALASYFGDVFELDWRAADALTEDAVALSHRALVERSDVERPDSGQRFGIEDFPQLATLVGRPDETMLLWPGVSPTGLLPDEGGWDLPRLVEWIEGAEHEVNVQLLSYKPIGRDKTYFAELENALRDAAARGVRVRLLLASWSRRRGTIEGLLSLAVMPGIEVRLATIPESSQGEIPFARVIHAKYLVVDRYRSWLGTSNWERSYFTASRNLGLFAEGAAFAGELADFFEAGWESPYAEDLEPVEVQAGPVRSR